MTALCRILEHIKNGKHYSIKEIAETLKLAEKTTLEILDFLADYNFLAKDEERGKVFLDPELKRIIQE